MGTGVHHGAEHKTWQQADFLSIEVDALCCEKEMAVRQRREWEPQKNTSKSEEVSWRDAPVQGGCRSEGAEAEKVVSSKKGREAEILQEETEAQQSE